MKVLGLSSKGLVKQDNEDNYIIDNQAFYNRVIELDTCSSIFVFDGVSGGKDGKKASNYAGELFIDALDTLKVASDQELRSVVDEISDKILKSVDNSQTTMAGVLLINDTFKAINVGDTKVYLFHNGSLKKVSIDDTYYEFLRSKNDREAENYKTSHIITACLGMENFIKEDIHIFNYEGKLEKGDLILVCSDGISDYFGDMELKGIIATHSLEDSFKIIERLVNSKGARDNYTLVGVEI